MGTDDIKSRNQKIKELRAKLDALRQKAAQPAEPADEGRGIPQRLSTGELRRAVRKQKAPPEKKPPGPIVYRRDLPQPPPPPPPARRAPGKPVALEEAVAGVEVVHPQRGAAFLVPTPIYTLEGTQRVAKRFVEQIGDNASSLCQHVASVCDPATLTAADIVFVDLETCGLSSSPLFLIGTMVWADHGFEVRQYLARTYAEEAAVIALALETCAPRSLLVTFNGKSFDYPFMRTRAVATGVPFTFDPAHLDLLHICRHIWRGVLPNCRLQTLETHVCNRTRYGDIPGDQIPDAYHAFVRSRNAWQLVEILKHNMLDLITLADLMTRLPSVKEEE